MEQETAAALDALFQYAHAHRLPAIHPLLAALPSLLFCASGARWPRLELARSQFYSDRLETFTSFSSPSPLHARGVRLQPTIAKAVQKLAKWAKWGGGAWGVRGAPGLTRTRLVI